MPDIATKRTQPHRFVADAARCFLFDASSQQRWRVPA